jgi:hypothetical protein
VSKPAGLTSAADAAAAATGAGGAAAGGVGVSMAFVPELQALRDNSTHVHRTAVAPNASARTVLFRGRQAEIIVRCCFSPPHPFLLLLLLLLLLLTRRILPRQAQDTNENGTFCPLFM